MTGFDSKRSAAQDKLDDETDMLTIVYQQGFADGKDAAERPWQGLTDEEILSTDPWEILRADPWMGTSDSNINPYQILLKVRTLEAKLKERNT